MGTTWDDAVGAFLRDARARNCSPATLTGYSGYLTGPRARQFVKDYRIESVADVTPEALRSFQMELLDAGLSAGTAATFHRILRNFLGFCRREGLGVPEESLGIPARCSRSSLPRSSAIRMSGSFSKPVATNETGCSSSS